MASAELTIVITRCVQPAKTNSDGFSAKRDDRIGRIRKKFRPRTHARGAKGQMTQFHQQYPLRDNSREQQWNYFKSTKQLISVAGCDFYSLFATSPPEDRSLPSTRRRENERKLHSNWRSTTSIIIIISDPPKWFNEHSSKNYYFWFVSKLLFVHSNKSQKARRRSAVILSYFFSRRRTRKAISFERNRNSLCSRNWISI